ncbi:MAG TPA: hypothetical protein DCL00_07905 [Opitutae bacterium]|nr:hypothetical protein [Opitutae bacterium]
MDVDKKNGGGLALKMKKKERYNEENPHERGLFIPLIQNETKEERANRILEMMEQSNDRLSRVLEIFNRMSR